MFQLISSLTSLPISLLPATFDPFVLKVIKEVHAFIYQFLYKDEVRRFNPFQNNQYSFSHEMEPVQYQAHLPC